MLFCDGRGNLWWPKKMSYEEVKKFVAEQKRRNKNKTCGAGLIFMQALVRCELGEKRERSVCGFSG